MSECLHCDIHELLESRLQNQETNLAETAAKVTEVLADLILMVPPDEQSMLMADILVNLGNFLVEKKNPPTKLNHTIEGISGNKTTRKYGCACGSPC